MTWALRWDITSGLSVEWGIIESFLVLEFMPCLHNCSLEDLDEVVLLEVVFSFSVRVAHEEEVHLLVSDLFLELKPVQTAVLEVFLGHRALSS